MTNEIKHEYFAKRALNFGNLNKYLNSSATHCNHLTSASFVVALSIGTNRKLLTDGKYLKKTHS